jgi:hypothetical protein
LPVIPRRGELHALKCRTQMRCAPVGITNHESVVCQGPCLMFSFSLCSLSLHPDKF